MHKSVDCTPTHKNGYIFIIYFFILWQEKTTQGTQKKELGNNLGQEVDMNTKDERVIRYRVISGRGKMLVDVWPLINRLPLPWYNYIPTHRKYKSFSIHWIICEIAILFQDL